MRVMNTSSGPVSVGPDPPRHVNTSDVLEPPRMEYLDEEPEIIAVVPAADWCAVVGEALVPLVVFVAMDDGRLYGVVVGDDGRVDLVENTAEDIPGFTGYIQTNNEPKENN
jgi:hypothetical protein